MTRDEILAKWERMTPRERDAWVAEKVMGWTKERTGENVWYEPESRLWKPMDHITTLPRFSTDIAAAWKVVEKITKKGFDVSILVVDGYNIDVGIDLYAGDTLVKRLSHHAPTAPEAICKAALLALEGERHDR